MMAHPPGENWYVANWKRGRRFPKPARNAKALGDKIEACHNGVPSRMAYIFFTSYSRINASNEADAKLVHDFVNALRDEVRQLIPNHPQDEISFLDTSSIETGESWSDELAIAIASSKVCIALYSQAYFSSKWCGKEYKAFLNRLHEWTRRGQREGPIAIIPVLWMKPYVLPPSATPIQFSDASLPREYSEYGLRTLMRLESFRDKYRQVVTALAIRLLDAMNRPGLPMLEHLDLSAVPSAWDEDVAKDPDSHKSGSISKTCFVFLSPRGWNWIPYADAKETIGALAQQISGLGAAHKENVHF
jgi:hypothetical protein